MREKEGREGRKKKKGSEVGKTRERETLQARNPNAFLKFSVWPNLMSVSHLAEIRLSVHAWELRLAFRDLFFP